MQFKAPDNYLFFYNEVIEKCKNFIRLKYWDEIDIGMLNAWLNNFKTPEEQYLSALILNKLVYRNRKAIQSMLSKLFHITLPNVLEKENIFPIKRNLEEWEQQLNNARFKQNATFYFSTITSNELGDSGNEYMRLLRKSFVAKELIISVNRQKEKSKKALIFIDDIIATGTQVSEFLEKNYSNLRVYEYIIFIPLMAHTQGIKEVEDKARKLKFRNFRITPVELLTEQNSFFHFSVNEHKQFDNLNTIDDLKIFYFSLVRKYAIENDEKKLAGFGELGLTLIFATGVPDNTLPIIHQRGKTNKWTPLYEKF